MPEIFWVMLGVPILFAVPLAVRRSKKWKGFGGLIKTLLVLVVVGVSLVALHDWFELSFKRHQLTSMGAEDRLNALKQVGWNVEQVGESLRQGAEKQFGPYVSLPTGLPVVSLGVPAPAAVAVAPEEVTLEELRRRESPLIPQEIYASTLGNLAERGWIQTSTNQEQLVVTSSEVPTPTVSSKVEAETISSARIITEGITAATPLTTPVTVQVFGDGTILVSSKNITETVTGAGGWLYMVRQRAETANVLDVAGQLSPKDPVRTQLGRTMAEMRTTLEFSRVITNPIVAYGAYWTETEKLVNRLLVLPVAANQTEVIQPPRGMDAPEGSAHLIAIAQSYRTRFWELVARQEVLAEMISVEKLKKDGPERRKLLEDTTKLEADVNALLNKIDMEISRGVIYNPVGLQWLNLTLFELGILKNNI